MTKPKRPPPTGRKAAVPRPAETVEAISNSVRPLDRIDPQAVPAHSAAPERSSEPAVQSTAEPYRYRVASSDRDYEAVAKLLRREGMPETELAFPTILAIQGKRLIGSLATTRSDEAVIAGPLCLRSDKRRPMVAFKLMANYEMAMRNLGIQAVLLWTEQGSQLQKAILKASNGAVRPYAVIGDKVWFRWAIGGHGEAVKTAAPAPKPIHAEPKPRTLRHVFEGPTLGAVLGIASNY